MRVAAQIVEHLLGAAERLLGINNPVGAARNGQIADECAGLGQVGKRRKEPQFAGLEGVLQPLEKQSSEQPREHSHWQEEAGAARHPALPVLREAAARHHAVQVRMMDQILLPGVQQGRDEANVGAQMSGISGDRLQRLGGGLKQDLVDDVLVLEGDRGYCLGHGEDDVEVRHGQEVGLTVILSKDGLCSVARN